MDGERAVFVIIMELHLGSVVAGFAVYKVANSGVFDDHFGPERITWKTEKIGAFIGGYFNNNVGPAS